MGVLFLTNDGYSTMCGHASLALGRLIVDHLGSGAQRWSILSEVSELLFNAEEEKMTVNLHAPCGLVVVQVPVSRTGETTWKTDTSRAVSYISVPSFCTGTPRELTLPDSYMRWPEIDEAWLPTPKGLRSINFSVAYGGAFYIIVEASELGFKDSDVTSLTPSSLAALSNAPRLLKKRFLMPANEELQEELLAHPDLENPELYGVIVTAHNKGENDGISGLYPNAKLPVGLCFFADQQVDRSPTGSGVQARVVTHLDDPNAVEGDYDGPSSYHSPLSWAHRQQGVDHSEGAFAGEAVEAVRISEDLVGWRVRISGWARYTGCASYVVENNDEIGKGFWFDKLGQQG